MKKAFLVILVIAAVVSSAFAGGLHYGLEASVDYDFNFSDTHVGSNEAQFAFKPYVYDDYFTVRLLAEWRPVNGSHGFDYLFDFDTTDFYTILASSLKYVDEISINSDFVELVVGKGSRQFEINYLYDGLHKNRAQLNINIANVKVELFSTDFEKLNETDYSSLQYGEVRVNLGLVEIEAAATRQAFYAEYMSGALGKNRIIPKVGAMLQFGLTNLGVYFTTDMVYNMDDDSLLVKVLDRWVLEALAEFKVGTFDITGKFYLDNRLQGYSNVLFPNEALFGVRADAKLSLGDFFTLKMSGDLPLKLDGALRVVRSPFGSKTMESVGASFEIGTWWKIGGEINFRGLISNIEDNKSFLTIIQEAQPTITAGIYTVPLDVTASVKLTTAYGEEIVPQVTVGASIRADNFLSNIKK